MTPLFATSAKNFTSPLCVHSRSEAMRANATLIPRAVRRLAHIKLQYPDWESSSQTAYIDGEKKTKSRRQITINQGVTGEYHELVGTVDFSTLGS